MSNVAVVTGAGSGVGQAIALRLAEAGWDVVLVGRRASALQSTVGRAGAGSHLWPIACDIGDREAVQQMGTQVLERYGSVGVLVNAAGTNTPHRSLAELSPENYRRLLDTNLDGAYWCVQAFLPIMRAQGSGTIVNIVSEAGLQASPKAGPAYVISKFGLAGLTQAINAEERGHGIRATAIFPGDIDTPLLDQRPTPPPPAARAAMLQPDDVAACALLAITLPPRAILEQLIVRPR